MRHLSKNILLVLSASMIFTACTKDETTEPPKPVYDSSINLPLPESVLSPVSYSIGAGVSDVDGNTYSTIVLGNGQEWMAENLKTTKYSNNDQIDYHNGKLFTISIKTGGSKYTTGTYTNIPLLGDNGTGATVDLVVNSTGNVSTATIVNTGSSYFIGDILTIDDALLSNTDSTGTNFTLSVDGFEWESLSTGAYSQYNYDNNYNNIYGKLYNYYVVADSRNVCPTGWHVPSDSDWAKLTLYMDPLADTSIVETLGNLTSQSNVAGGRLKSKETYWLKPNDFVTDDVNFSALPAGTIDVSGSFFAESQISNFHSSTQVSADSSYSIQLSYGSSRLKKFANDKNIGSSIRCVKD